MIYLWDTSGPKQPKETRRKNDLSCPFSLDACGNVQGPVAEDNSCHLVGASVELVSYVYQFSPLQGVCMILQEKEIEVQGG